MNTTVPLRRDSFSPDERVICRAGALTASAFRFSTGVDALRLTNDRGEIVMLPFQGQQIWRCSFDGVPLTMKSSFDEPRSTADYLETYGGFLLHCGATAMGVPGPEDSHPIHGELPNAPYQTAAVETGEDATGRYVAVTGVYDHTVAFNVNYRAEPSIVLYEGATLLEISMKITNRRAGDMDLMYLMHVNFRPVDSGEIVYSAPATPERVRPFVSVPTHMKAGAGVERLKAFLDELVTDPSKHHVLNPELPFDPEIVFSITYDADEDGWAHSMMVHADGAASYVAHRPEETPFGIRWIARTADEDALGLVLPATAEHKGYTAEREKGHLQTLGGGDSRVFHVRAGLLAADQVAGMRSTIEEIIG